MIYISGTTYIPRTLQDEGVTIIFTNQSTNVEVSGSVQTYSPLYYSYTPGVLPSEGQYSYKILDADGKLLEGGIAQMGDFKAQSVQYPMTKSEYTTYNYND